MTLVATNKKQLPPPARCTRRKDIDEYVTRHTKLVQGAEGLTAAIDRIQGECTFGLTAERFKDTFKLDEDYPRLLRLAEVGVERELPEGFEPQGPPNTLSTSQLKYKDVFLALRRSSGPSRVRCY